MSDNFQGKELNLANPKQLAKHLSNGYENAMWKQGYLYYLSFYLAELGLDNLQEFFSVFSDCQCCNRHQQRRPDFLGPLPDYPSRHGEGHQVGQCQCQCRHLTRWLCRAWQMIQAEQVEQPEQA